MQPDPVVLASVQHPQPMKAVWRNDQETSRLWYIRSPLQKVLHIPFYHVIDLITVVAVHLILHIRLITAGMGIHHLTCFKTVFLIHDLPLFIA